MHRLHAGVVIDHEFGVTFALRSKLISPEVELHEDDGDALDCVVLVEPWRTSAFKDTRKKSQNLQ